MIKTSDHELDGVAHCSPSKYPNQDWLHLAGTQRSSEAQWTSLATRATALWKHHACNSPTHQNEQPEHMSPAPKQQSTQKSSVRTTSEEFLLGGQQLKPEQCNERSGSQRQSEPLVFEGADHVAIAVAPIKRAFNQKPTSADPLSTNRCHHQDASLSGAHLARRGSMSAPN